MRVFLAGFGLIIILAVGYWLSLIVPLSGALNTYEPLLVEQCERLEIAPGTEDIVVDVEANIAFVSSADRRAWFNDGGSEVGGVKNGGIYMVDLDDPTSARLVSPDSMTDFLPHGIDLWHGDNGEKRLFVVSHPSTGEEIVEIFEVAENASLTHLKSISFDEMYSPNDVVAVGPSQFYATNDRRYDVGLMSWVETNFALPLTSVVYFDGNTGREIENGFAYANGINISNDGGTVYVSEVVKRRISVLSRDLQTNALTKTRTIKINAAPDNIDVDDEGRLWIGGHPKPLEFAAHAKDSRKISPSHVVKIDPETDAYEDVFISLDGEINASSVGAAHNGKLLVGAVFDPHIMVCPIS